MADDERPQGGGDKSQRRWLLIGLAAGGLAFAYVWIKNRGGAGSSSGSTTAADTGTIDSGGGSSSPTDLRDVVQVNYAKAPADTEDNQPTTSHNPKPKPKPKPRPKRKRVPPSASKAA